LASYEIITLQKKLSEQNLDSESLSAYRKSKIILLLLQSTRQRTQPFWSLFENSTFFKSKSIRMKSFFNKCGSASFKDHLQSLASFFVLRTSVFPNFLFLFYSYGTSVFLNSQTWKKSVVIAQWRLISNFSFNGLRYWLADVQTLPTKQRVNINNNAC
jgi:hypothetical protein